MPVCGSQKIAASRAIPKGSEALLIVEADLEKQFEVRQLISEHRAVIDLRVFPILYTAESKEAKEYSETIEALSAANTTLTEIGNQMMIFFKFLTSRKILRHGQRFRISTLS
jgi:hypothetical protein